MSNYSVLFLPLDPAVEWWCQSPRHPEKFEPQASALLLITLADHSDGMICHQASYVCDECRATMEADL